MYLASREKENVLIRSGACSVTVLPQFGGKIGSIKIREQELLQAPLAPITPRTRTMAFDRSDAGGWDECLPSVAACTVLTAAGPVQVPDHGDVWRVAWEESGGDDPASIALRAKCFSMPLVFERALMLTETGSAWKLKATYKLTNEGKSPVPWSWAAHSLYAVEPGDRITLPDSIDSLQVEGSAGDRLGKKGDTASWPVAELTGGGQTDLRVAQSAQSGIGDKLFAGPLKPNQNWCALERPSARIRIKVSFDPGENPYLGLWICYGGWPGRPGPKQACVAIEPSTAPRDSLAETGGWSRTLEAGESSEWTMHVDFELT